MLSDHRQRRAAAVRRVDRRRAGLQERQRRYPNLFLTFGPNSGPGHHSALVYMESQIDYIVRAVRLMDERNLPAIDVRKEKQAEFNRRIQRRLARTTWSSGCQSWYLTDEGFNAAMYPGFATQFARQLANLDLEDYQVLNHAHGRSASC